MEKVNLCKFTHILLLKNDGQFKQKSDKQPKKKKKQSPNLLRKKSCPKKKKKSYLVKKKKKKYHTHNELPMCKCTWAFSSIK